jgi:transcriptional regulator with XRE-family HTH domain
MTNPVRDLRLQRRLTQEQLANDAEVSVRTIQRVEAGSVTPSWDTLEALARVLDVSPEKLMTTYEMSEEMKQALRKIHEGMHALSEYLHDHPEEIVKFGASSGTYVFQPRNLPEEHHHLVCGETLPFHHAHLMEVRPIRMERGENPDGSGAPWIRKLCPGPSVTAVIDVAPWRSFVWRATEDFALMNKTNAPWFTQAMVEGTVERIDVKKGDRLELVQGDRCGSFLYEFGTELKLVRVEDQSVWTEFDHEQLPVVPVLDHERDPWQVPRWLR